MRPTTEPKSQRWPSQLVKIELAGQSFHFCINMDPRTWRPHAVFVHSGREGSDLQALANNVGILVSIALQHGATLEALKRNLKRPDSNENPGWPALFVPTLIDTLVAEHEAMSRSLESAGLKPPVPEATTVAGPVADALIGRARALIAMAKRAVRQARAQLGRMRRHTPPAPERAP